MNKIQQQSLKFSRKWPFWLPQNSYLNVPRERKAAWRCSIESAIHGRVDGGTSGVGTAGADPWAFVKHHLEIHWHQSLKKLKRVGLSPCLEASVGSYLASENQELHLMGCYKLLIYNHSILKDFFLKGYSYPLWKYNSYLNSQHGFYMGASLYF